MKTTFKSFMIVSALCITCSAIAQAQQRDLRSSSKEGLTGVDTFYDFVVMGQGHRLRTIMTKPQGVEERLPAILFIQWLSCDPVELPAEGGDGWTKMLHCRNHQSQPPWKGETYYLFENGSSL